MQLSPPDSEAALAVLRMASESFGAALQPPQTAKRRCRMIRRFGYAITACTLMRSQLAAVVRRAA